MRFAWKLVPLLAVAAALPSPSAQAQGANGGAAVPPARPQGPLLSSFNLRRPRLFLFGRPARVSFRLVGRGDVLVRLRLVPKGDRRALRTISLGWRASGRVHSVALTGSEAGALPQGAYVLRIAGHDRRRRPLRRAPHASSSARLSYFHHRFPLVGALGYGGEGSRFGARRSGHTHQGQDLPAPEGASIVAPRGGTIETVGYQAASAGHYVVLDGRDEDRDYVFMHLRSGSVAVTEGQHVRTGQGIGQVGTTGRSTGPHLHFEVWAGRGWYVAGGAPVDPLPLLLAWDSWS